MKKILNNENFNFHVENISLIQKEYFNKINKNLFFRIKFLKMLL